MANKDIYIRFAKDALRSQAGDFGNLERSVRFIKALRELVQNCPDVTLEELTELLLEAERDLL